RPGVPPAGSTRVVGDLFELCPHAPGDLGAPFRLRVELQVLAKQCGAVPRLLKRAFRAERRRPRGDTEIGAARRARFTDRSGAEATSRDRGAQRDYPRQETAGEGAWMGVRGPLLPFESGGQ